MYDQGRAAATSSARGCSGKTVAQERYEHLGRELLSYIGLKEPHVIRRTYSGAVTVRNGRIHVSAPWPTSGPRKLYVLAHEVAHAILHVGAIKAGHPSLGREELEAETWAISWLRARGVHVSDEIKRGARDYVIASYRREYLRDVDRKLKAVEEMVCARIPVK